MDFDNLLILDTARDVGKIKALASRQRLSILTALRKDTLNVNELARHLEMPQSTVATHIAILAKAGLICVEKTKSAKGTQKRCRAAFGELLVRFPDENDAASDTIEVEMPIGLFTQAQVTPPCGLCSAESIIGFLDTPAGFLNPDRMKAGLLWCGSGFVEYQFPNNSLYDKRPVKKLEIIAELSSEVPGTNKDWLSDITVAVNTVEIGSWTSPGDFGDKRGIYTPSWWKPEGSQYGLLKNFSVTEAGSFVDGVKISAVTLADLSLPAHHSVRVKIGVKDDARHVGGMNIFGRGFGNYNTGLILRQSF